MVVLCYDVVVVVAPDFNKLHLRVALQGLGHMTGNFGLLMWQTPYSCHVLSPFVCASILNSVQAVTFGVGFWCLT